jgi:hypothetical protein
MRVTLYSMARSRADEYRKNAEQCEQAAKRALNPALADEYLNLTKHWRQLADLADLKGY